MASRYWVGGTASWDATAGTKWATTSGGAGGAAVPTSSDDVFFDANSGAVTITVSATANCNNFDCTGFTGTWAGSSAMNVFGNFTLATGMTRNYTGQITFVATSTGKTITLNGKTMASPISFDQAGGGWILQDAFNNGTSNITVLRGSFDTNGMTITCGIFSISGTTTRAVTLGSSTVNVSTLWSVSSTTNLTFSGASSTIALGAAATGFTGAGLTYGTVTITANTTTAFPISGANTFGTFTYTNGASKTVGFTLAANQTVSGTFTATGDSATNRPLIQSDTLGTARTITAATVSITNVDFQDITGAGAGSWSGTSIGDAQGNSGITFTTPTTRYWIGGTGNWDSTGEWSTSSGGGSGASVPLPQDDVVFDASSFSAGSQTVTANMPRLGKNITFAAVTNTPAWANSTSTTAIYGSLTLASGMTLSGTNLSFSGRSAYTLTSATKTFPFIVNVAAPGGTLTLQDDMIVTANLILNSGTFDLNDFNTTSNTFISNSGLTRELIMGSGNFTVTSTGNVWNMSSSGLTITPETSTIVVNNTSATGKTFIPGGKTYNNITFSGDNITVSGAATFATMAISNAGRTNGLKLNSGSTVTITALTTNGSAGNLCKLLSTTGGSRATLSKSTGTVTASYLDIKDSNATGGATWNADATCVDSGNNLGWVFSSGQPIIKRIATVPHMAGSLRQRIF